ncbi:MAG: esterase, partial [Prevotella sp.]|nr:esterase [Prevotella sp.]
QTFQNPRQDGVQEFIVTKALVKEYKAMTENNFSQVTADEQHRVYGLFGDNDEVVHTYDLFLEHYPQAIHFHGEHRLNETVLLHYLIPVIRWIDDRQEGRERPTVFIDFATMHDSYMKPVSSLRKAYEFLIENYNVYIVAPAPSAQPETMLQTMTWVEEYINVPAWNRVIFTNSKQQLLGDYYLAPLNPPEGGTFFGTVLEFGKDELKTYEDVITFFERMGGQ